MQTSTPEYVIAMLGFGLLAAALQYVLLLFTIVLISVPTELFDDKDGDPWRRAVSKGMLLASLVVFILAQIYFAVQFPYTGG